MNSKIGCIQGIENIVHKSKIVAVIIRRRFKQDGISFFSDKDYPLQLGAMTRPKGYQISPHIHKEHKRVTKCTQEVLFIQSGQVRVDFYSKKQSFFKSSILNSGDMILLVSAGHAIEFIKKSVIFEVKNGPYVEGSDKCKFSDKRLQK